MKTDSVSASLGQIGQVGGVRAKPEAKPNLGADKATTTEFKELFSGQLDFETKKNEGELKFSAHAIQRMADRNIELSPIDMQKIRDALEKMALKGARESLILSDKGAFIVNVKDQKVITAIDPETARDSTFTNIDSTVII